MMMMNISTSPLIGSPREAARPDSAYAAPELTGPAEGLEFLFLPYFWFLAERG